MVPENLSFFLVLGDADADGAEAGKRRGDACQDVTEVTQVRNGLHDGRGCGNDRHEPKREGTIQKSSTHGG